MREELVGVGEVSLLKKVGSLAAQLRRRVSSGHHQTLGVQVELSPEEQFERVYLEVLSLLEGGPCRLSKPSTSRGKLLVQLLQLLLLVTHLGKYCYGSSPMAFMLLHKRQVDKQRETYIKSFLSEASCKLPKLRVLRRWCRHPLFLSFFLQRIP